MQIPECEAVTARTGSSYSDEDCRELCAEALTTCSSESTFLAELVTCVREELEDSAFEASCIVPEGGWGSKRTGPVVSLLLVILSVWAPRRLGFGLVSG